MSPEPRLWSNIARFHWGASLTSIFCPGAGHSGDLQSNVAGHIHSSAAFGGKPHALRNRNSFCRHCPKLSRAVFVVA